MAKILVVDDNEPNRELIVILLRHQGHQSLEAADGAEALVMVRAEHPDLVICDILMPVMDGYEFVRQLRADPNIAHTEIIFHSANYGEKEARKLARSCGVTRVLVKPSLPQEVMNAIDRALAHEPEVELKVVDEPVGEFDREHHLRLITDKLAEKADALQSANQRLAALTDLNLQLASERDPHVLLDKVCKGARKLIGSKYAFICARAKGNGQDIYFFRSGLPPDAVDKPRVLSIDQGLFGQAMAERKPLRFVNPDGSAEAMGLPPDFPPLHCGLIAPIMSLATVYGWILLVDKMGSDTYSDDDEKILSIHAAQVGRIYENGSLYLQIERRAAELQSEITQRKEAEAHIQRLAHFDGLTGLPNRVLLNDRIKQAVSMAQRSEKQLAVLFLDLDHFKNVNDSLGHNIGDKLLVEVAKRLKDTVREEDTVSRLGGDEFILLLPDADTEGATYVAEKLLQAIARSYQIEQHELSITPSIGIAMYPSDGADFDVLSKCADVAMYSAKQNGRNGYCFYTAEMQANTVRTLRLENGLRRALERSQLQLYYQPFMSLHDGRIVGAEALLRWQHPELGMVSPGEFIPIAEDSGQILHIGEWVLRHAARQLVEWMNNGLAPMTIAVNLSMVQFRHAHLPQLIGRILEEEKLAPQHLELELTEGFAMENPPRAVAVMDDLNERGIRIAIDDFGTGYSSLSYLKRFKIDKLKIDQSFVHNITQDEGDKAIVKAIISMADSLGMQTIAEGVETAGQLAYLREHGCQEMQGYFFSHPLPADKFADFVRARAWLDNGGAKPESEILKPESGILK